MSSFVTAKGNKYRFWSLASTYMPRLLGAAKESMTEPNGEMNEAQAIFRAQQGDAVAFERLYRLHCRRVYGLCLQMVRDPSEAEDLTQEAFLLLFRKIATFRGDSAFSTWLYRITVNLVLMRRRKKSLAEVSLEAATEPNEEAGGPRRDFGEPDPRMAGSLDRINLERALAQLPHGYKTIFVLHDVQGYEHSEIARILNCSIGNTKSQLHKARERLRELLEEIYRAKARDVRLAARKSRSHVNVPEQMAAEVVPPRWK
jgi:RNA polymerase sigma-70 factor, ECF subfamily